MRSVVNLPPAVAMVPPAPANYRRRFGSSGRAFGLRLTGVMTARHLIRWPLRSLSSIFGVAMAVAILVASLWSFGSIDKMIDVTFFRSERHDVSVAFGAPEQQRAVQDALHMPGVMVAEPFRSVAARISHLNLSKRLSIVGRPRNAGAVAGARPRSAPDGHARGRGDPVRGAGHGAAACARATG